jgi:predicted RNA-binding Zn-ribbon protein involved in translation (DUF1610 family)
MDFRPDPELEGKQFVDFLGIGEDNGELTLQPRQRWTREQQLDLLDTHPLFTGRCPQCGYEFQRDYTARVHWDCPQCGWLDDTV